MTVQFSTTVRNAMLDVIETSIGTAPTLEIRSGAAPATCATAASGTVLATLVLPLDWMSNAASGAKACLGRGRIPLPMRPGLPRITASTRV